MEDKRRNRLRYQMTFLNILKHNPLVPELKKGVIKALVR